MSELETLLVSLELAIEMLAADGYGLEVDLAGDVIDLRITAGDDVCADCLVPKDVMVLMAAQMLGIDADDAPDRIRIRYPDET